ncbi:hypothetical protein FGO68_gene14860 [Halteria grandinella]|uniref:Uncharacterized protein n=1 Tax=Halteria grandinella TaxID=5974 RepID=A0A8J8P316_HALGN|nr:hypothetical protein FGO68_gene14860 [Halteria grandinella]
MQKGENIIEKVPNQKFNRTVTKKGTRVNFMVDSNNQQLPPHHSNIDNTLSVSIQYMQNKYREKPAITPDSNNNNQILNSSENDQSYFQKVSTLVPYANTPYTNELSEKHQNHYNQVASKRRMLFNQQQTMNLKSQMMETARKKQSIAIEQQKLERVATRYDL